MDASNTPDIEDFVDISERLMRYLEVVAAFVLVGLFAVGVFDFLLQIVTLVRTGAITDTSAIVGLIDEILLLFIIVEIFQTVVAYAQEQSVIRIVIAAGLIAVARKIISFHSGDYGTPTEATIAAAGYALLLLSLVAALYAVGRANVTTPPDQDV
ncbi:phosphate-starvation-inducible PsiE family protein [Halarchaeum salinum]|uniref:Phosphate-starvation-inducible PsiE family protein n=1 Tax=Halarchaeum salinum TaxID=489912 RepID=A0AAV3S700_9EURY